MESMKMSEIIEDWEETGEISLEMAESVKDRLQDIMGYELSIINDLINKNKAHTAR